MADATVVLHQPGNQIDFRFRPAGTARVNALVWGEIYRGNGNWRCVRSVKASPTGLASLAKYDGQHRLSARGGRTFDHRTIDD